MITKVYSPSDRPDIQVRRDGVWCQGELRMWQQREDGAWWANVSWRPGPNATYLDTVPADDVRLDEAEPQRLPFA